MSDQTTTATTGPDKQVVESTPPDTPQVPTAPEGDIPDASPQGSEQGDDQADATDSPNKEAAKWRTKLRAAEQERDALQQQLTAHQRAIIDWRSSNAVGGAVDPQLLDAAGIDINDLLDPDTGHLDMAKVDQFIDATATRFRVHRDVKPNPQQGNPSQARGGSLADLFDPNRR